MGETPELENKGFVVPAVQPVVSRQPTAAAAATATATPAAAVHAVGDAGTPAPSGRKAAFIGVIAGLVVVIAGIAIAITLFARQGKPSPAEAVAQHAANAPQPPPVPATAEEAIARADEMQRGDRVEAAGFMLEAFLHAHPDADLARMRYAMVLAAEKRLPDARKQYLAILQKDPQNVLAELGLAKVASWSSDLEGALKIYDDILSRQPTNYDARVGKAFTLLWLKREGEARQLFRGAQQENPADVEVSAALKRLGK